MESVKIPPSYFLKMATIDYSDWRMALVREFVQNSYDAGATEVRFSYSDGKLYVKDNGSGMTETIIRDHLLTLGGSLKNAGSVGGLGKAKEILYFSWPKWEIHSKDISVFGEGNQFDLTTDNHFVEGTTSVIQGVESDVIYKKILSVVSYSTFDLNIYWNNTLLKPERSAADLGCKIGSIDGFGDLYRNVGVGSNVVVQARGLYMFSSYLSSSSKHGYIFNITVPSYESLTSNRDSFAHEYRIKFEKLIAKLTVETNADVAADLSIIPISDHSLLSHFNSELQKHFQEYLDNHEFLDKMTNSISMIQVAKDLSGFAKITIDKFRTINVRKFFAVYKKMFPKLFTVITKKIYPETCNELLDPQVITIGKLWERIVNMVALANNIKYGGVGFILDPQVCAMCYSGLILVNPLELIRKHAEVKNTILDMYMCAAHELAHLFVEPHNEDFVLREEEIFFQAMKNNVDIFDDKRFYNKIKKAVEAKL